MFNSKTCFRSILTLGLGAALLLVPHVCAAASVAPAGARITPVPGGADEIVLRFSLTPEEIDERLEGQVLYASGKGLALECPGISDRGAFSLATLMALPSWASVVVEATALDSIVLTTPDSDEFTPGGAAHALVEVGPPAIMRDLRLVEVRVNAARSSSESGYLTVYPEIEVALRLEGGGANQGPERARPPCAAFDRVYRACVANYEPPGPGELELGGYLIITHDHFFAQMEPFAEWKARQGYATELVPLSVIDPSPTNADIKDYILNAYETWDPAPVYVLLVGDIEMPTIGQFPAWIYPYGDLDVTDHPYSTLDGDDYFPDLFVGRLSVDSQNELSTILAKTLSYERNPYMGQTAWYERALVVAGNFTPGELHPITMRLTKLWVRDRMYEHGYAEVDTVFYPPTTTPDLIKASINEGVGIVNYRGWADHTGWHFPQFYVEDIYGLANGYKLPIMTSVVCATGDFDREPDECFGEIWLRAGTPANPRGGAAFLGCSYLHSRTAPNNAIDAGIYWGLLEEDVALLGPMMLCGKLTLYDSFPEDRLPGGSVEMYFHTYNILGDPSIDVWTSVPESLFVTHPDTLPLGANIVAVQVGSAAGPVEGVWVSAWKDGETRAVRQTGSDGSVELQISPPTEGTLALTVTGHNALAYLGAIEIVQEQQYVGYLSHAVDDDALGESDGNGDGEINPDETIELVVTLHNFGTESIEGVSAALAIDDAWVTMSDSLEDYGDLAPGASLECLDDFGFSVDPACTNGHLLTFDLVVTDASQNSWSSLIEVSVGSSRLGYRGVLIDDSGQPDPNGYLDPGEDVALAVSLVNSGDTEAPFVEGVLRLVEAGFTVTDSVANFGTIAVDDTVDNAADPFAVSASASLPPGYWTQAYLLLTTGEGWTEQIPFVLYLSEPDPELFTGPDAYGYFAYDNGDETFPECPTYDWIEIDTAYGGTGTDLGLHDDWTVTVTLPFTFTFYGEPYTNLSICSNGWLSLDETNWIGFRNWDIANPLGPKTQIDAYWDDLDPDSAGAVFTYYDAYDGRFIVEWSRVYNNDSETFHTFEAILYDPAEWPTGTGDGEILLQYHTIDDPTTSTVGVEQRNEGIEYLYNGIAPPTAAMIGSSVAVKFTTDPPFTLPVEVEGDDAVSSMLPRAFALSQPSPNPCRGQAAIAFALPAGTESGARTVSLKVYNLQGQLVRTLAEGRWEPGYYRVIWDGRDGTGGTVGSGVYFCRMDTGDFRATRKLLLLH